MKEPEFRKWMATLIARSGKPYKQSTINTHVTDLNRIEEAEEVSLDKEYKENDLESLIELYTYTADDKRAGRKNPTKLRTKSLNLHGFLSAYKSQLNKYKRFCQRNDR